MLGKQWFIWALICCDLCWRIVIARAIYADVILVGTVSAAYSSMFHHLSEQSSSLRCIKYKDGGSRLSIQKLKSVFWAWLFPITRLLSLSSFTLVCLYTASLGVYRHYRLLIILSILLHPTFWIINRKFAIIPKWIGLHLRFTKLTCRTCERSTLCISKISTPRPSTHPLALEMTPCRYTHHLQSLKLYASLDHHSHHRMFFQKLQ